MPDMENGNSFISSAKGRVLLQLIILIAVVFCIAYFKNIH